ncbi:MAG: DUF1800 domain-containing protein [Pseudomonadota bacterium]
MTVAPSTIAAIRFGYGFRPGTPPPAGPEDLVAQLGDTAADDAFADLPDVPARIGLMQAYRAGIRAVREGNAEGEAAREAAAEAIWQQRAADDLTRLGAAMESPAGLRERLFAFWCDHFTVVGGNRRRYLLDAAMEVEAIRPHLNGRFADMLRAVSTHPAMLEYLDQTASIGPNSPVAQRRGGGLNENLAREILELHTLGVDGSYTQADVREFAEALTGFSVRRSAFVFDPRRAEPGTETVLGTRYGQARGRATLEDAVAILEDLAVHPETARHIARKLATHFVADDPPEALVAHLEAAYRASDGDLGAVHRALIEHPDSWAGLGGKVKQPFDFIASSLRALGLGRRELRRMGRRAWPFLNRGMQVMGQPLRRPGGPDGWPEMAESWITPQGLAARIDWAGRAARRFGRNLDPRDFLRTALDDAASQELGFAVGAAETRLEGVVLVLASPEFNRR